MPGFEVVGADKDFDEGRPRKIACTESVTVDEHRMSWKPGGCRAVLSSSSLKGVKVEDLVKPLPGGLTGSLVMLVAAAGKYDDLWQLMWWRPSCRRSASLKSDEFNRGGRRYHHRCHCWSCCQLGWQTRSGIWYYSADLDG